MVTSRHGLPYLAEVIGQDGARVRVAPITGPKGVRTITSREVVDHWRKARSRQPGAAVPLDHHAARAAGDLMFAPGVVRLRRGCFLDPAFNVARTLAICADVER